MGGRTWDRSSSFPKTKAWGQGCRGGSRGGARPPLFLDQNEARRDEKCFCEDAPPSLSGPGWSPPPPPTPLSEGLDPPLGCFCENAPLSMSGPGWSPHPAPTPLSEGLDPPLGCHHSLSLVQSNLVGTYAIDGFHSDVI